MDNENVFIDSVDKREGIEWNNSWWEKANSTDVKRVVFLGDSVTRGYRSEINKLLVEKERVVDLYAASSQVTDILLYKGMQFFFELNNWKYEYAFIQLGGQHGFDKRVSVDEEYLVKYKECYKELIALIRKYCDKIVFVSATPTVEKEDLTKFNEERNTEIIARNNVVKELADEYNTEYVDLYYYALKNEFVHTDYIHFTKDDNQKIAKHIFELYFDKTEANE